MFHPHHTISYHPLPTAYKMSAQNTHSLQAITYQPFAGLSLASQTNLCPSNFPLSPSDDPPTNNYHPMSNYSNSNCDIIVSSSQYSYPEQNSWSFASNGGSSSHNNGDTLVLCIDTDT